MFIDYRIYNYKNIKNKKIDIILDTLADMCDNLCDLARDDTYAYPIKAFENIRREIREEFLFEALGRIVYGALECIVCELDNASYSVGPVDVHTYEDLIGFDPFQNYTDVGECKKNLFEEITGLSYKEGK